MNPEREFEIIEAEYDAAARAARENRPLEALEAEEQLPYLEMAAWISRKRSGLKDIQERERVGR